MGPAATTTANPRHRNTPSLKERGGRFRQCLQHHAESPPTAPRTNRAKKGRYGELAAAASVTLTTRPVAKRVRPVRRATCTEQTETTPAGRGMNLTTERSGSQAAHQPGLPRTACSSGALPSPLVTLSPNHEFQEA
ncbi:hypothetical protein DPEC_G00259680 [Dallia pectoralis]|uniref:Uncharacterized protein n=1 Tax=Dallia pectoralis TaxID=75939 RepID=A0ACC2FRA2_DALPE|nr:hypothetical protein DPEC_G00259680 [Dallia pectoralis]